MKKLLLNCIVTLVLFTSCHKELAESFEQSPKVSLSSLHAALSNVAVVGNGSGNLVIDGTNFIKSNKYTINIAAGTYTGITIQNINNTIPVVIQNSGIVNISGNGSSMTFNNVSNLIVSGNGTPGIAQGFAFSNINYRPVTVNGLTHDLTLQYFSFINTQDYTINFSTNSTIYNGTDSSCFNNITLSNITCSGTGQFLQIGGGFNNGVITGLVKNLTINNLNFSNSPNCGEVVFVANAENYNFYQNTIHDINQTNNNHNGIFMVTGNGAFHDNLVYNHQGNAIRAWGVTIGSTPKNILIYNNTVHDSRKYSAFEVQSFATNIIPGLTTYANANVYSNTAGNINLSKDWYGVIVDVYNLFGGTCLVSNNTGYNFPAPNPNSYIVSQQSTTVPILSNNTYNSTNANTQMTVGTGSGNIVIDGSQFVKSSPYVINIASGNYNNITIQNINNSVPVVIQNSGQVNITGNGSGLTLNNVSNLTVSGNGTSGIAQGFAFSNINYRPLTINGLTHDLTLQNMSFVNTQDYTISFSDGNTVYDGTNNTCFYDITLANITCNSTGQFLQMGGGINNNQVTGLVKNLTISNLNFSNSANVGVVAYVGNAENYNIYQNTVHDIYQLDGNNNGIFLIVGNGAFHDNLVYNHQGCAIRAWCMSVGTTPKNVLIYNNTVHDSRKSSAFEVQSFSNFMIPGQSTFANASVYSNITGNLNTTNNWYGVIVDVYNLFGGTCSVSNNTGFNFPSPNPNSYIVNQQGSTVPSLSNNSYYATAAAAGIANVSALTIF